jgi:hypothetical protein
MGFRPRRKSISLRLFADYHQFYLQDEASPGDLTEAWTAQAVADRMAVGNGVVGIGTESKDTVRVEVELLTSRPNSDLARWDHVTECSLDASSGRLLVAGCTDYVPDARRVSVPGGRVGLRTSHRYGPREQYRVQLWPGEAEARVLKRFEPPPPAPPPPVATELPRTLKKAREQARLGNTDMALESLIRFSGEGDASASASVAEILGLLGRWQQLVPYAQDLLARPDAVYAVNVFWDMCYLIRRAAQELDDPELFARTAQLIPSKLTSDRAACLIEGHGLQPAPPATPVELDQYRDAVKKAEGGKRFAGKPDVLARHIYALAVAFRVHDELIEQWPRKRHLISFDQSVAAARVWVRRGRDDEAWRIVESSVPSWWPVDAAQVAPVILAVDPELSPLITADRGARILAIPRGPEATGA